MSISSLLSIGSRAMTANYAALQVTGNNVANANTAGYSRQSVELATAFSQQTGSGFFGKGVDVATVSRAHSDFLTREAATTASLAAADARAQQPAAAARDGVPDRRGGSRLRRAADVQRLRRRLQQAAGFVGAAGRAGARRRSRRALSRRVGPDRFAPGRHHAGPQDLGRLDQRADGAHRRSQPAHRQRQGHRPRAERPARPARHGDRRPVEARPGDDGRGRRRHGRRLPRRRAEARARRRVDAAHDGRRSLRPDQGADRHQRRRHDARLSRRLHRRRLGRRACCACRTTTSPTRAA